MPPGPTDAISLFKDQKIRAARIEQLRAHRDTGHAGTQNDDVMFGMRHGVNTLVLCAGEGAPGSRRTNGEFGNIITAGSHVRASFVSLNPNSRLSSACSDRGG